MADPVVFSVLSVRLAYMQGYYPRHIILNVQDILMDMEQVYINAERQKQENGEEFRKSIEEVLAIAYDLQDIVDTYTHRNRPRCAVHRTAGFTSFIIRRHTSYVDNVTTRIISFIKVNFANIQEDPNIYRELGKIRERMGMLTSALVHVINIGSESQGDFPESSLSTLKQHEDEVQQLPDDIHPRLRACLLYFGIFPKEMEIPVRRLIRLWLAEGFVEEQPEVCPEDTAVNYIKELKERRMVVITIFKTDGRPKRCRLTAKFYDIILREVEKTGLFYLHKSRSSTDHEATIAEPRLAVRRVVEYANIKDYPQSDFYVKHLRSYISFNFQKKDTQAAQIGEFVSRIVVKSGYSLLNVLDLEGVYKPALPDELGNLYNLSYLGLRWTFLDALPVSARNLVRLQTLDVKHTYIRTLPIDFRYMSSLRHLYLNDIPLTFRSYYDTFRKDYEIQTLWGLFYDKRSRVILHSDGITYHLKHLGLTCHSSSTEELGKWIPELYQLQSLKLRCKDDEAMGKPSSLRLKSLATLKYLAHIYLMGKLPKLEKNCFEFPPSLKDLTLSVSMLEEDPMPTLGQLPNLTALRLLANSYSGNKMICKQGSFGSLVNLKLWVLEDLEEWVVEEGAMQKLKELEIRRCHKLKSIPETLLGLEELTLRNIPTGKELVCKQGSFGSLVKLKLWVLEDLEECVVEEGPLQKLKELEIRRCPKLRGIPETLVNFSTFKVLKLTEMPEKLVEEVEAKSSMTDTWKLIKS